MFIVKYVRTTLQWATVNYVRTTLQWAIAKYVRTTLQWAIVKYVRTTLQWAILKELGHGTSQDPNRGWGVYTRRDHVEILLSAHLSLVFDLGYFADISRWSACGTTDLS